MSQFLVALKALLPVLEPVVLQEWTGTILPALQASVAKISNPDEQLAASALLGALDKIAQAEIAKL